MLGEVIRRVLHEQTPEIRARMLEVREYWEDGLKILEKMCPKIVEAAARGLAADPNNETSQELYEQASGIEESMTLAILASYIRICEDEIKREKEAKLNEPVR